jgi:hypothetical protein
MFSRHRGLTSPIQLYTRGGCLLEVVSYQNDNFTIPLPIWSMTAIQPRQDVNRNGLMQLIFFVTSQRPHPVKDILPPRSIFEQAAPILIHNSAWCVADLYFVLTLFCRFITRHHLGPIVGNGHSIPRI